MISLDLWRSRIGGWRGHAKSQFLPPHFRKSYLSSFICLLWRITTCLSAITISILLIIGGVEINPGPGSTTDEEISPMEIDCLDDVFESSQTLQHSPISSQVLPMTSLDLSSQCSSDVPITPEKGFSTPKSRKRKGYQARKERNRANIKKRRVDDDNFRKCENEIRLKRFNDDYEDSDFQAKHKENQFRSSRMLLKDPDKRAEHNMQHFQAMRERLKDPDKRAEYNMQQLQAMRDRLKDPDKRAEYNMQQLQAMRDRLKDPDKRAEYNMQQLQAMRERLNDPEKRAEYNMQQLQAMRDRLKDPDKRAEYNMQQLQAMTERLKDPDKRAKHNKRKSDKLKDPSIRDKHNSYVLEKYIVHKGDVEPITLNYFFQISQGPTFVCCCCGCLHFRRSVVVLTKTRLDSMSDSTFINQVCYNFIIYNLI